MENVEITNKLLEKVEKLGYSETVKDQIREAREKGLIEFPAYERIFFDGHNNKGNVEVEYQLNFFPSKNKDADKQTPYLQTVEALLTRDVVVPHKSVNGYHTQEIEALLSNPVTLKNGNQTDVDQHVDKIQRAMTWALENAPETFAALLVKFNPPINMAIPENVTKIAEQIQANTNRYNIFSSYFNLSALEVANMMQGRSARKHLFKTASPEQDSLTATQNNKREMFTSWLQVAFDQPRRADGSCEMIFHPDFELRPVLMEFNFRELTNMYNRNRFIDFMEKGSLVLFNNLNDKGDRQVLSQANGVYKGLDLFDMNGNPITNHRSYLKQRHMKVGTFVEMKKGPSEPVKPANHQPQSTEDRAQKFQDFKNKALAAGKSNAQNTGEKERHQEETGQSADHEQQQRNSNARSTGRRTVRTANIEVGRRGQRR